MEPSRFGRLAIEKNNPTLIMNLASHPYILADLRRLLMPWAFALLLPVRVLLTGD